MHARVVDFLQPAGELAVESLQRTHGLGRAGRRPGFKILLQSGETYVPLCRGLQGRPGLECTNRMPRVGTDDPQVVINERPAVVA